MTPKKKITLREWVGNQPYCHICVYILSNSQFKYHRVAHAQTSGNPFLGHRCVHAQLCGQHDFALVPFWHFRQILFAKPHLLHAFAGHSLRFCFQRIHYLLSKVTPVRSKSRWMTGQNVTKGGAKRRERRTLEPKPRSCRRNATASWRKQACGVSKKRLFGNGIIFCVDTNL